MNSENTVNTWKNSDDNSQLLIRDRKMTVPEDYAEMMDKLNHPPDDWDVPGLIADVSERVRELGDGATLAVIDTLCFRMKDIAELIHHEHAKLISPATIRSASVIAATFVPKSKSV